MQKRKADVRQEKIRNLLLINDYLSIGDFCKMLECSEATIRNDLRYLEEKGLIKRTYGGAVATGNTGLNSTLTFRSTAFKEEKEAIADYVVNEILENGQTIILDTGTTNVELAQKIIEKSLELTVITNSFAAASVLTKSTNINLYLASGNYDHTTSSFHDDMTRKVLETLRADIYFMSLNGISVEAGCTVPGPEEAITKQIMIKSSKRCIPILDHTKLGKIGLKVICDLKEVDMLITDEKANEEEVSSIKKTGIEVIKVAVPDKNNKSLT